MEGDYGSGNISGLGFAGLKDCWMGESHLKALFISLF
jgi:hypothetical protein